MISVSQDYKDALADDNRNFYCEAVITMYDGNTVTVTNEDIWQGGMRIKQAVSGQSDFEIGACVIGELTLVLNNIYGTFDDYSFDGAIIVVNLGLYGSDGTLIDIDGEGGTTFQKGVYYVDEVDTNGSLITLTCLDAMVKFDRDYSDVGQTFPATLQTIVTNICSACEVTYSQASFHNSTYTVTSAPDTASLTCRDVLSMVCEIAGSYGTINTDDAFIVDFYDIDYMRTVVPVDGDLDGGSFWVDVDSADGGSFWSISPTHDAGTFLQSGTPDYELSSGFFKFNRDKSDVRISGVKLTSNGATYLVGSNRYALTVQNNVLINAGDEATILADIGARIIGTEFRPYDAEHLADPTLEAGDTITLTDHLGNVYYSVVTQTEFSAGERQKTECNAQSAVNQRSVRYSAASKETADYMVKSQAASNLVANAYGLFKSEITDPQVGGKTEAVHNASTLDTSTFAIINNTNGLQVGTRSSASDSWTWTATDAAEGAGLTEVLNVVGINADWIRSGSLVLGGDLNTDGTLEVYNAANDLVVKADKNGIGIYNGRMEISTDEAMEVFVDLIYSPGSYVGNETQIMPGYVQINYRTADTTYPAGGVEITPNAVGVSATNPSTGVQTSYASVLEDGFNTSGGVTAKGVYTSTSSAGGYIRVLTDGAFARYVSSSKRYKHDITAELDENPDRLYELEPKQFKYNDDYLDKTDQRYGKNVLGFIAEEVAEVMPGAVDYDDEGRPEMWNVHVLVPAMLKLIQEQKQQIDELRTRIEALERRG